ncbi:MAG: DUF2914 domain-containing protein [Pseudomonadota bacterium]|nr:DUF2914 domain-containing protein [Pseudomonadota bacterium]
MHLPETQNAHHLHAFKKGYRLALESKPLTNMPSMFRYDRTLREYYEQGWSQANEELEAGYQASQQKPWRDRIAWLIVIVIGSIATAVGLVTSIQEDQAEQQARILGLNTAVEQANTQPEITPAPTVKSQSATQVSELNSPVLVSPSTELSLIDTDEPIINNSTEVETALIKQMPENTSVTREEAVQKKTNSISELSILTPQQRQDLTLNQQELQQAEPKTVELSSLVDSNILIESAVLTPQVKNKQATEILTDKIPKHIRQLYFFTQVKDAKDSTIYHRWLFKNQVMALIPLKINSNLYRTWSSKRMTSAWQGEWMVEVLNDQQKVIYRQTFQYGNR